MTHLARDIQYAFRTLRKWPAFTAITLLTLALGIGGATAIFSVVNGVLLDSLPYGDPDRLVVVWQEDTLQGTQRENASVPDFVDWESQTEGFERLSAHEPWEKSLTSEDGDPERIAGGSVTWDFFPVMGVAPALGRGFLEEEDQPGGEPVALLSYGFWQSRYGGDESVLGRTFTLDGIDHRVVGVMPAGFVSPVESDESVWIPLRPDPSTSSRARHMIRVFGTLAPGVSLEQAQESVATVSRRLAQSYPETNEGRGARVEPIREVIVGDVRKALWILLAGVGAVLAIACFNVAGAQVARALARGREMSVRLALGAGRWQLFRQLLVEGLVLALMGGVLGLAFAGWGVHVLKSIGPENLPRLDLVEVDPAVLLFTLAVSIIAGVVSGLTPAYQLAKPDLQSPLREGRVLSAGRRRLYSSLVVLEVAGAVVLLFAAALLVGSFFKLRGVDPGFQADRLVKVEVRLPETRYPFPDSYPTWPEATRFLSDAQARLERVPGVESAAFSLNHPLKLGWTTSFEIDNRPPSTLGEEEIRMRPVGPGYFRTIGQRLLRGRSIDERAGPDDPKVAVINRSAETRYFPEGTAVGERISFWGSSYEVIGVVDDVRFAGLGEDVDPALYPSSLQVPLADATFLLRTGRDAGDLGPSIREAIWGLDPDLAAFGIQSMGGVLAESVAQPRFNTFLFVIFALVALALSSMGLYGLILFTVQQQMREMGIRMTLGARRQTILALVMKRAMYFVGIGLAIGLAVALGISQVMSSLLFELSIYDWRVGAFVVLLLAVTGGLAAFLPSWRASRLDPADIVRPE